MVFPRASDPQGLQVYSWVLSLSKEESFLTAPLKFLNSGLSFPKSRTPCIENIWKDPRLHENVEARELCACLDTGVPIWSGDTSANCLIVFSMTVAAIGLKTYLETGCGSRPESQNGLAVSPKGSGSCRGFWQSFCVLSARMNGIRPKVKSRKTLNSVPWQSKVHSSSTLLPHSFLHKSQRLESYGTS